MGESVPIIDVSALYDDTLLTPSPSAAALATVAEIHSAFKTFGLFLLTKSPTPSLDLTTKLSEAFAKFYALPGEDKRALDLRNGGWAWRGTYSLRRIIWDKDES